MSAAVDADLARYDRECEEEQLRAETIERLAGSYLVDARTLGDAICWIDSDTEQHKVARKRIGALMLTAMQFSKGHASVASGICALSSIGEALLADPALLSAAERMAEREVERLERHPDHNGD